MVAIIQPPPGVYASSIASISAEGVANEIRDFFLGKGATVPYTPNVYDNHFTKARDPELVKKFATIVIGLESRGLEWINSEVLPTIFSDTMEIDFETITFAPAFLDQVPAEAVSRSTEQTSKFRAARNKRYGKHFILEGDRVATTAGQLDIARQLTFISKMFTENAAWIAFETLISPKKTSRMFSLQTAQNEQTVKEVLRNQKDCVFLPHRYVVGMSMLIQAGINAMSNKIGLDPTMLIMPGEKRSLLITGNEQYYRADKGGAGAVKRAMGKGEIDVINGVSVRVAPTMPLDDRPENNVCPQNAYATLGEYVYFKDRWRNSDGYVTSRHWRYQMYDLNLDNWKDIELHDLLDNCNLFDDKMYNKYVGKKVDPADLPPHVGLVAVKQTNDSYELNRVTNIKEMDKRFLVKVDTDEKINPPIEYNDEKGNKKTIEKYGDTPFTPEAMKALLKANKHLPFDFVGVRCTCRYRTAGTTLLIPGIETGFTSLSVPRFAVGQDAGNQTFIVTATGWFGAHVINPDRVINIEHVFYDRYLSGSNTKIIDKKTAETFSVTGFSQIRQSDPSMYVLAVPIDCQFHEEFVDITGRMECQDPQSTPEHFCGATAYANYYGYYQMASKKIMNPFAGTRVARICYRSSVRYNNVTGTELIEEGGNTHHGPREGPGCQAVRDGRMITTIPNPIK